MKKFYSFCKEQKFSFDGIAKGKTVEDIAKKHKVDVSTINSQIKMGIKIEQEHTKSTRLAKKIAMDHVWEKPDYYTKLKKVEEDAPVNNVGGGRIAGVSPGEIPPVRMKKKKKIKNKIVVNNKYGSIPIVNQRWSTPFPYKPFNQ